MATLRTGILVDTFDPVCVGHLDFCRDAMERKKLDRVVLALSGGDSVPCGASRADRWRMLVSACSAGKGFIPEDAGSSGVASPEHKYRHDKLIILSLPDGISRALCPSVSEYCSALGLYGAEPAVADAAARVGRLFAALNPHRFAHSLSVAKTSRQHAAWTVGIALVCGIAGLTASYYLDTSAGATIVLAAALCYAVSLAVRGIRK